MAHHWLSVALVACLAVPGLCLFGVTSTTTETVVSLVTSTVFPTCMNAQNGAVCAGRRRRGVNGNDLLLMPHDNLKWVGAAGGG